MRGWAPTRPRRGFSTAGLLRAWIESLETAHGSQSWCPAGAVPRGRQVQPWQPLQQPGRRSVVVAGVGSHGIQRLIWRARHSSVPVAAGGAIRGDGSAGAASAGVPWEFPWKLGLAGAAASLLYHMHHQRAERQRQMLALPEPPPDVSGQTLEFANQLAPPPEFRHPFEDKSLAWRAMYAVRRAAYLVFVFAPFCMASTLLPVLSGHSAFMKWYLSLMVKTLEDAGASFQKLGQWFSMRPDLFDQSVIQALSSLRDDGPRHPFSYTRKLLEDSFECPLEAVFEYLDVEPVASGSVAQVHRGRLSESFVRDCIANGDMDSESQMRDVAVKVIHPGVVESAWIDGNIIFGSVQLLAGITGMGLVMPFDKDGFCRAMARQLNLKWEAYNLKQFSLNFAAESGLEFPRVVAARDSVLIESWFSGKPITDLLTGTFGLAAAPAHGTEVEQAEAGPPQQTASAMLRRHSSRTAAAVDSLVQVSEAKRKALAKAIFDMTIKMYLRDNFIHADLHAGNILYSTDPLDTRVFVLDAGMTTCLEKDWASPFGSVLCCSARIAQLGLRIQGHARGLDPLAPLHHACLAWPLSCVPPTRPRARVQRRALQRGLGLCSHVELTGALRSLSIARCALRRRG